MGNSDNALAVMRGWSWEEYHPDFGMISCHRSLADAVKELAFHWHGDAPGAMLSLLASGKLLAHGSFKWRAYRHDEEFQNEGHGDIPAARWRSLSDSIEERLKAGPNQGYSPFIHLPELGLGKTEKDDWAWRDNRFAVAFGDVDVWMPGYSEEWFSAWNIEVLPAPVDVVTLEALPAPELAVAESNKGGAPRQYDWEKAVAAVVFKWAEEGSWQPASQADVAKALADWFATEDRHPSPASLKEHARWLFKEFQGHNSEANNLAA